MRRTLLAAALALAACQSQSELNKKMRADACKKNLDCAYGLECVEGGALADGGVASGRTCQFHSFGDCEGDGTEPGPDGQPQCLNPYRCRNGHCTVQCAGHKDCKEGEVCKVGICQRAATPSRPARRTGTASSRRPATTGSASPARPRSAATGTSTAPPGTAASMESVNNL